MKTPFNTAGNENPIMAFSIEHFPREVTEADIGKIFLIIPDDEKKMIEKSFRIVEPDGDTPVKYMKFTHEITDLKNGLVYMRQFRTKNVLNELFPLIKGFPFK